MVTKSKVGNNYVEEVNIGANFIRGKNVQLSYSGLC